MGLPALNSGVQVEAPPVSTEEKQIVEPVADVDLDNGGISNPPPNTDLKAKAFEVFSTIPVEARQQQAEALMPSILAEMNAAGYKPAGFGNDPKLRAGIAYQAALDQVDRKIFKERTGIDNLDVSLIPDRSPLASWQGAFSETTGQALPMIIPSGPTGRIASGVLANAASYATRLALTKAVSKAVIERVAQEGAAWIGSDLAVRANHILRDEQVAKEHPILAFIGDFVASAVGGTTGWLGANAAYRHAVNYKFTPTPHENLPSTDIKVGPEVGPIKPASTYPTGPVNDLVSISNGDISSPIVEGQAQNIKQTILAKPDALITPDERTLVSTIDQAINAPVIPAPELPPNISLTPTGQLITHEELIPLVENANKKVALADRLQQVRDELDKVNTLRADNTVPERDAFLDETQKRLETELQTLVPTDHDQAIARAEQLIAEQGVPVNKRQIPLARSTEAEQKDWVKGTHYLESRWSPAELEADKQLAIKQLEEQQQLKELLNQNAGEIKPGEVKLLDYNSVFVNSDAIRNLPGKDLNDPSGMWGGDPSINPLPHLYSDPIVQESKDITSALQQLWSRIIIQDKTWPSKVFQDGSQWRTKRIENIWGKRTKTAQDKSLGRDATGPYWKPFDALTLSPEQTQRLAVQLGWHEGYPLNRSPYDSGDLAVQGYDNPLFDARERDYSSPYSDGVTHNYGGKLYEHDEYPADSAYQDPNEPISIDHKGRVNGRIGKSTASPFPLEPTESALDPETDLIFRSQEKFLRDIVGKNPDGSDRYFKDSRIPLPTGVVPSLAESAKRHFGGQLLHFFDTLNADINRLAGTDQWRSALRFREAVKAKLLNNGRIVDELTMETKRIELNDNLKRLQREAARQEYEAYRTEMRVDKRDPYIEVNSADGTGGVYDQQGLSIESVYDQNTLDTFAGNEEKSLEQQGLDNWLRENGFHIDDNKPTKVKKQEHTFEPEDYYDDDKVHNPFQKHTGITDGPDPETLLVLGEANDLIRNLGMQITSKGFVPSVTVNLGSEVKNAIADEVIKQLGGYTVSHDYLLPGKNGPVFNPLAINYGGEIDHVLSVFTEHLWSDPLIKESSAPLLARQEIEQVLNVANTTSIPGKVPYYRVADDREVYAGLQAIKTLDNQVYNLAQKLSTPETGTVFEKVSFQKLAILRTLIADKFYPSLNSVYKQALIKKFQTLNLSFPIDGNAVDFTVTNKGFLDKLNQIVANNPKDFLPSVDGGPSISEIQGVMASWLPPKDAASFIDGVTRQGLSIEDQVKQYNTATGLLEFKQAQITQKVEGVKIKLRKCK